jgi:hypothetical protein
MKKKNARECGMRAGGRALSGKYREPERRACLQKEHL